MTKQSSYRITSAAKADLVEIRQTTLRRWGKTQSVKYIKELQKTFQLLAENPAIGSCRSEFGNHIFSFPYVSHMIYYQQGESKLMIIGILHQRMVPKTHLTGRGNR
jgi:toxin ParE1/3/4